MTRVERLVVLYEIAGAVREQVEESRRLVDRPRVVAIVWIASFASSTSR